MTRPHDESDPVEVLAGQFAEEHCQGQHPSIDDYARRYPQYADEIRELFPALIVEELAARFAQEQRDGKNVTIDEFASRYPEYADKIRELFPALVGIGGLGADRDETLKYRPDATRAGRIIPPRSQVGDFVGDYVVVREIGRGGMGIVYEAVQETLSRRVALKVLPFDSIADDERRERFRREAEAAATLDHPHIVPVYEVGEHEGQPYFSMKFVEGMTLTERLADGPLAPRVAAELLLPVCRAIAEAHRCGVLHRDLKPSNILLDRHNRPLVSDFGLAKRFEAGSEISQTNAAVGTPSYMAPEQAMGRMRQIGITTDVYGLGAVLYATLLARPPFQAATVVETLRQVATQDPVPPRQMNSAIDRDLDTICLKCLAKEPAARYQSADAVADDLERYLSGQPIKARPLGVVGRTVRWCKRYPMRAVALGLLVVTCGVAVTAAVVTSSALHESERSYQRSRDTVDYFLTRISEEELLDQPGMQPLRRDLLERALEHYKTFVSERADDPSLRTELADAYYRVGLITEKIDTLDAALEAYQQAERVHRDLLQKTPRDAALRMGHSKSLTAIGNIHFQRGTLDESLAAYRQAANIREELVGEFPADRENKRLLANAQMHLGLVEQAKGQNEQAAIEFEKAEELRRKLLSSQPDDAELKRDLARGLFNQGRLNLAASDAAGDMAARNVDLDRAEQRLEESRAIFESLVADEPQDPSRHFPVALCYRMLADLKARRDATETAEWYGDVLGRLETLAADNPRVVDYGIALGGIYLNLGYWDVRQGNPEIALEHFQKAGRMFEQLILAQPNAVRHRSDLAVALLAIGELEATERHFDEALTHINRASQLFQQLAREYPDQPEFQARHEACLGLVEQLNQASQADSAE